ncbi:MAG: squalene synthase HpnD [Boseongicola sp. SB0676_bin_33]|nr:squalene synthase HpnD [Boseongicola sp. SB0676_bin_33]
MYRGFAAQTEVRQLFRVHFPMRIDSLSRPLRSSWHIEFDGESGTGSRPARNESRNWKPPAAGNSVDRSRSAMYLCPMQFANVNRSGELAAKRYAETLVANSGSAFFWAMRRMLPAKRDAMYAIYAFCREVDDIADEPGETIRKQEALNGYRRDVERLYRGEEPARATVRALVRPVLDYGLAESDFNCVIDGMMTDAAPSVRIPDEAALATYVDRVACSVGRMSCRVFGLDCETGRQLAASLGSALLLTNILRDVREDARRETVADQPAVDIVCQGLSAKAWDHFAAADKIMSACRPQDIRPARMMRAVYGKLLERIVGAGFSPFPSERISVGSFRKACLALRHGLF